ncbi:MAG: HEAT repeat domain-containing protein [candidate division Zixibacteria bacterium]|nr:HEAT repeat domain-containing protein [candidate division Zixibacteria bacterium]
MLNVIAKVSMLSVLLVIVLTVNGQSQTSFERRLDSLYVIASSAEIHYQDEREPAMDAIAAQGARAVPYLVDKFATRSAWEKWTVFWILQRIDSLAVPGLIDGLDQPDHMVVARVCWTLGDIGHPTAVEPLIGVCQNKAWQVRDEAIRALGRIGNDEAADMVVSALQDTIGQVRKSAVVACGQLQTNDAVTELVHTLGDEFYGARLMAVNSLLQLDTVTVVQVLADSLNSANEQLSDLACQVLGEIGTDDAMVLLLGQTASSDPDRRAHAAVALVKADPLDNCGFRQNYYDDETDRLVRLKIEAAIDLANDEE